MFGWLRFWRKDESPAPRVRPAPAARREPAPEPLPEPVLIRGEFWKDTAAPPAAPAPAPRVPAGVDRWIVQLRHRDAQKRESAAIELGRLGEAARAALPALVTAAVDVEPPVRAAALAAAERIEPNWPASAGGEVAPVLIAALESRFTDVWQQALLLLSRVGAPAVPGLLAALSGGAKDSSQVLFARALGRIGPAASAAVPALTANLANGVDHVRREAATALEAVGPAAGPAAPALALALGDRDIGVRQAALRALARLGPAAATALPAIVPFLADPSDGVRDVAADALAGLGPPAVAALAAVVAERDSVRVRTMLRRDAELARWWSGPNVLFPTEPLRVTWNVVWLFQEADDAIARTELVHVGALKVLAKMGPGAAESAASVTGALADRSSAVRAAAATALGRFGPAARDSSPALARLLADGSDSVRRCAAVALPVVNPEWSSEPEAAGLLAALTEDLKTVGDRGRIAAATFRLVGAAAVPHLLAALESPDRVAREAAATILGELGPTAAAAAPALTRALADPHGWVREAAARALQRIAPAQE